MKRQRARRGFVLFTVLWSLSLAAALALSARVGGADAITAAHNRIATERGRWIAAGCLATVLAALDAEFGSERMDRARDLEWAALDETSAWLAWRGHCRARLDAVGRRVDVNAVTADQLIAVLTAAGVGAEAQALTATLLDWRDADETPRAAGAESGWYLMSGRPAPRNGPLEAREELRLVRGFDRHPELSELFDVESGPLLVTRAAPAALAAIPGFSIEVRELLSRHDAPHAIESLSDLLPLLPTTARDLLVSAFDSASRAVTFVPQAWVLTLEVDVGRPAVRTVMQARLVRSSAHLHVSGARTW